MMFHLTEIYGQDNYLTADIFILQRPKEKITTQLALFYTRQRLTVWMSHSLLMAVTRKVDFHWI